MLSASSPNRPSLVKVSSARTNQSSKIDLGADFVFSSDGIKLNRSFKTSEKSFLKFSKSLGFRFCLFRDTEASARIRWTSIGSQRPIPHPSLTVLQSLDEPSGSPTPCRNFRPHAKTQRRRGSSNTRRAPPFASLAPLRDASLPLGTVGIWGFKDRRVSLSIPFGNDLSKDGVSRAANKLTESEQK